MHTSPDESYYHYLSMVQFTPVFILGLHRSGTSILYKMLTATNAFNPVTAYHIIEYDSLLSNHILNKEQTAKHELTSKFREKGLTDRGIDRLSITADFAEEYGFLLGQKTTQMQVTSKNNQVFKNLCKKIQYIAKNDKPVLLKNPYDFTNFLYLKKMFPSAQFIFIHRHPYKTLSSLVKAVSFLFTQKNPYTSQLYRLYNKIFENPLALYPMRWCFTRFSVIGCLYFSMNAAWATRCYLRRISRLPSDCYTVITYEELCAHPETVIKRIMSHLHIAGKDIEYDSFIHKRKTTMHPCIHALHRFISKTMHPYFTNFSYTTKINEE